ncbi:rhodanese-like domain-containing protein [Kocuria sp. CPCC 205268]|uniref:rhodanese-like domain-containing protein n=1 Tax=Kocuria oxytropis TaxID=3058913 RepID=UPI0034D5CA5E
MARLYEQLRSVAGDRVAAVERAREDYLGSVPVPRHGEGPEREVPRDELLGRASRGEVVVLDVRPAEEYAAAHIPGAVSIPLEELPARLEELPAGQEVVAYCRGAWCVLAHEAVALLRARGRRAHRLEDGLLEWRLHELPLATDRTP